MDNKQFKKRIIVLGSIFLLLTVIYLFSSGLRNTISRYIKREQDEIKAYYTSLYFASDGEGKSLAVESNIGYVEFNLMNYIGEDVTQRDIEYKIVKPSTFYDINGNPIAESNLASAEKLYVLDVWGKPKEVAKNTYLYTVEVVNNTGESAGSGNYKFTYEKLGTSAVGKTHHVNLKLTRNGDEIMNDEDISIVVQLERPYREVFIINMKTSSRIVAFSNSVSNKLDVPFEELYIQSADIYSYFKNGTPRTSVVYGSEGYKDLFTSKAVKLTITWSGFTLDETELEILHNGTLNKPDNGESGSKINEDEYYLDITKATIASIKATEISGELVIFVPQSSDFILYFLRDPNPEGEVYVKAKIEIYVSNGSTGKDGYAYYNEEYYGFTLDSEGYYTLFN